MQSKYSYLLEDGDARRWFENPAARSKVTAMIYLRTLGLYCEMNKTSPKAILKIAKEFKDYPVCYDVLGVMVKMRCKGCRNGGGPPFCKIRKCCQKDELEGCWECDEFETCKKLDFLKPNHGDAHIKNLRKIKKYGIEAFLEGKRYW